MFIYYWQYLFNIKYLIKEIINDLHIKKICFQFKLLMTHGNDSFSRKNHFILANRLNI